MSGDNNSPVNGLDKAASPIHANENDSTGPIDGLNTDILGAIPAQNNTVNQIGMTTEPAPQATFQAISVPVATK